MKKVTDSISCEELTAASAYVDPEKPPIQPTPSPGPQQKLDWCIFVCVVITLTDSTGPKCEYFPLPIA